MKTGRDIYNVVIRQVRNAAEQGGLAGLRRPGLKTRLRAVSCLVGTMCLATGSEAWAQVATTHTTPHRHAPVRQVAAPKPHSAAPAGVTDTSAPELIRVASSREARDGGGGMMRQETAPHAVQTIGKQFIEMRSPTSTALDLVKNLPSMNVTTPDPSGMEGGQIQTRGLTDLDMGLMLDGAPAAAAKYLNEDIDSENLESVEVTPGSSATDLPAISAAGGVMNERSRTASQKFGGMMDFSYGTNNMSREFIRLDSGEIGHTGVRSYFSFSNTHSRSWMGSGINQRKHIDFGLQKDWSNGSNAKLFVSWNSEDFTIDAYPDGKAFENYKRTGEGYGRNSDPTSDNYWQNNNDHWNQIFLTAPIHVVLPAKFAFDLQPYFSFGQGWDASPGNNGAFGDNYDLYYNQTTGTHNITNYFQENEARQVGAVAKIGYQIDRHNHLSFGYWYENNQTIQNYPVSATMQNGQAPSPNNPSYQLSQSFLTGVDAGYELHSLFIQDTAKYFNDKLQIHAGFKFVMSDAWNKNWLANAGSKSWTYGKNGTMAGQNGANTTEPLPQLSISYTFNDHHQIYVNAEGDYRQPSATDLGWLTPVNGQSMLKNQYSIKEELGYRYHDKYVMFDLSLFNYNVTNRILDTYLGANQYMPIEGGNQTMRGFDVMVASRPIHGFSPYASFEYLHATQDSNVQDALGQTVYAKGKEAVMAPHVMANFGLTYKYRGFFANAAVHYTGAQSVAMDNSERMPGYVTDTLSLGYHFKPFMYAKSPTFKLNFTNLTGSIVRTGAMGAIYGLNHPTALSYPGYYGASANLGRALSGNSFMVEPRFTMTGTVSTSF
ncbi:TonB-dependent receptor [Komagataeibacter sp. AV436]|uniref:TonB-dependent receptor n=1 Tax=Komagataeibacter melomenusus TaxID=2766578 RepID=A0ABX2AK49_9PROT|nr:TonB-dependent receptor [Komagataeibacter melomenusus]MBV1832227.1 TonB-dependent receptor [Komagataeibacter melomenusus]NPC68004.1 TonB-dependent receptor [Komagataeibacter melomenusus]